MAWTYRDAVLDGFEECNAQRAAAVAELESGLANEDVYTVREARKKISVIDSEILRLNHYANQIVQSQQAPQVPPGFDDYRREDQQLAAKYGLTPQQYNHATCWTNDMPKQQRIEKYIENTRRYQALRAGGYRDELDEQNRR